LPITFEQARNAANDALSIFTNACGGVERTQLVHAMALRAGFSKCVSVVAYDCYLKLFCDSIAKLFLSDALRFCSTHTMINKRGGQAETCPTPINVG
jgi:hypothetical protein